MVESRKMPKGWDDLSPLAKASYVDADFVEAVDDAMYQAASELNQREQETVGMSDKEYIKFCMEIMRKYTDPIE